MLEQLIHLPWQPPVGIDVPSHQAAQFLRRRWGPGILPQQFQQFQHCLGLQGTVLGHRLIFSAHDALGAAAGLEILRTRFALTPNAISGLCSASPLASQELRQFTDVPVISNAQRDPNVWSKIVL